MRLTLQSNRESLKRYSHVKPARGGLDHCTRICPGTSRRCGREMGHHGPHVAFGLVRKVVAVWDGSFDAPTRPPSLPDRRPRPRAIRRRTTERSLLGTVCDFLTAPFSSVEELAWALFFLVFVGFAVGGFLLIYLG